MRICSFVPAATEMLYALGLGPQVVGVSHECDFPPEAAAKPSIVRTWIDSETLSSAEIDRAVQTALAQRRSLYEIDVERLHALQPDLIVTQALCEVCAVDTASIESAVQRLSIQPRALALHPHTLDEALDDIRRVGEVTGRRAEAEALRQALHERLARIRARIAAATTRPRVFCLEWLEPPMASGHWVPEQVEAAGGVEVLGRAGAPSRYVTGDEIAAAEPDVLMLMPCGLSIPRMRMELQAVARQPWWEGLPAVRRGNVHLVDGSAYFNRSGPRLVDGIELLARLLRPDTCGDLGPAGAAERLDRTPSRG